MSDCQALSVCVGEDEILKTEKTNLYFHTTTQTTAMSLNQSQVLLNPQA